MKNSKEEENIVSGTFTWAIENFSKLKNDKHCSDVFVFGGFKWRLVICPKGINPVNGEKQLSLYLGVPGASSLPPEWKQFTQFSLTVVNQLDAKWSVTKSTKGPPKEFKENNSEWGFKSFMPLSELSNEAAGYVVNDKCIVEAKVDVSTDHGTYGTCASMASIIKKKHEGKNADCSSPYTPCFNPVPPFQCACAAGSEKLCILPSEATNPTAELMDFRGLGDVEKAFVPLLEEVCSQHPSLIECLHKRNRKVCECALRALGRLLHFLKSTKAKDMTDNACVRLQSLWEDVEMFKFDLAWLEPHVQSALGMKKRLDMARRVKRLRDDVESLDVEKKRRSAALAATEADLVEAKRDLEEEEDGFADTDVDIELGYGMH